VNFFASQDRARQVSRRLVAAYIVATILIVAGVTTIVGFALFEFGASRLGYTPREFMAQQAGLLVGTAVLTTIFILGASAFKTSQLAAGGGRVAMDMGGTLVPADVQDPLRRRLRNVVEEMAIASGVPVPEIYVLEQEDGINAFAAGYSPSDAAVAVTRGALEILDRDELQGVVAHEFSHILNGDMRLNIRLMGVLFGIMALGLIGRLIVRGGYHGGIISSRRDRGAPVILVIGIGLVVLGAIGVFFARLIKASVSRQREYLADASAVQFTRQNLGIANALKKIGGYSAGSAIVASDPEEVSHMLFGSGSKLVGLFATHPPLVSRIQALDPSFREADFPPVDRRQYRPVTDGDGSSAGPAAGFAAAVAGGTAGITAESISRSVGDPGNEHVDYARQLRATMPESLDSAARSPEFAYLLAIALVIDRSGNSVERQFALLREQLGAERARVVRHYYDDLIASGTEHRLPLLEVSFPALRRRPARELDYLVALTTRLIEIDGQVDLYEYCFNRILTSQLASAAHPAGLRSSTRVRRKDLRRAALQLLRVLANYGHDDEGARNAAFAAGKAQLGSWAEDQDFEPSESLGVAALDRSLDTLAALNYRGKESLLRAISETAAHDGVLRIAEAQLIRAVCAALQYPLPPVLVPQTDSVAS